MRGHAERGCGSGLVGGNTYGQERGGVRALESVQVTPVSVMAMVAANPRAV